MVWRDDGTEGLPRHPSHQPHPATFRSSGGAVPCGSGVEQWLARQFDQKGIKVTNRTRRLWTRRSTSVQPFCAGAGLRLEKFRFIEFRNGILNEGDEPICFRRVRDRVLSQF